jgi:hypothetical protein
MKNKEKYDLRDLEVRLFCDRDIMNFLTRYAIIVLHKTERKRLYETRFTDYVGSMSDSSSNSIDSLIFEKLFEWLEEECEEPVKSVTNL